MDVLPTAKEQWYDTLAMARGMAFVGDPVDIVAVWRDLAQERGLSIRVLARVVACRTSGNSATSRRSGGDGPARCGWRRLTRTRPIRGSFDAGRTGRSCRRRKPPPQRSRNSAAAAAAATPAEGKAAAARWDHSGMEGTTPEGSEKQAGPQQADDRGRIARLVARAGTEQAIEPCAADQTPRKPPADGQPKVRCGKSGPSRETRPMSTAVHPAQTNRHTIWRQDGSAEQTIGRPRQRPAIRKLTPCSRWPVTWNRSETPRCPAATRPMPSG